MMETLVIYDTKFGNTRKLADTMANAARDHGTVRLLALDAELPTDLGSVDLLIVGGPTQAHGLSPRMRQFTDGLVAGSGAGTVAAIFDTRYRLPAIVSGSAAKAVARRLKRHGIHMIAEPESFFVTRGEVPQLEAGELERAAAWLRHVANRGALSRWCAA